MPKKLKGRGHSADRFNRDDVEESFDISSMKKALSKRYLKTSKSATMTLRRTPQQILDGNDDEEEDDEEEDDAYARRRGSEKYIERGSERDSGRFKFDSFEKSLSSAKRSLNSTRVPSSNKIRSHEDIEAIIGDHGQDESMDDEPKRRKRSRIIPNRYAPEESTKASTSKIGKKSESRPNAMMSRGIEPRSSNFRQIIEEILQPKQEMVEIEHGYDTDRYAFVNEVMDTHLLHKDNGEFIINFMKKAINNQKRMIGLAYILCTLHDHLKREPSSQTSLLLFESFEKKVVNETMIRFLHKVTSIQDVNVCNKIFSEISFPKEEILRFIRASIHQLKSRH